MMSLPRQAPDPSADPPPRPKRCTKYRHLSVETAVAERGRIEPLARQRQTGRRLAVYHCRPCSEALGRDVFHLGHDAKGARS